MFQQYAKAFKSSQLQEFLSQLNKSDLPDATTGFYFLAKVFSWMHQDLNKIIRIITRLGCYAIMILTA